MMYINDVLINASYHNYVPYYEWESEDLLFHIKKAPVFLISSKNLYKILTCETTINKRLMFEVEDETKLFSGQDELIKYSLAFTDGIKVIFVIMNKKGQVILRSALLPDEEYEVMNFSVLLKDNDYNFSFGKKIDYDLFLTKQENALIDEIKSELKKNNLNKLKYWYYLLFKNTEEDLSVIKKSLTNDEYQLQLMNILNKQL